MRMKLIVLLSMAAVAAVAAGPTAFFAPARTGDFHISDSPEAIPSERTGQSERDDDPAWEPIAVPSPVPDRMIHVTVYHPGSDRIFQVGGSEAGQAGTFDGINRAYDPVTDTWDASPAEMPVPVGWTGYGLVGNVIYIFGGMNNENNVVATTQAYDITANSWTTKADRPVAVAAPLSATWRDSLIYVMGGFPGAMMHRVDIYDPATDAWQVGTDLPQRLLMGSAAIIGDTIYIAQAIDVVCLPRLLKGAINPADPTRVEWIEGPEIEPVFNGATVAIDDEVYWLGGYLDGEAVTNRVWQYSQTTGEVTPFEPGYPVNNARTHFAAARVTTDAREIYGMAGDMDGDFDPPNRTYVKLTVPETGTAEETRVPGVIIESVRPSVVRDRAVLSYSVSRAGRFQLGVYNAAGRLVRTLADRTVQPGTHTTTWDRTDNNGLRVANGAYFLRLLANGQAFSARVVALD